MIPPTRTCRERASSRMHHLKPPGLNDVVEIWWDGEDTYFRGALIRQNDSPMSFLVAYDDGDLLDQNLDLEVWRYAQDGNGNFYTVMGSSAYSPKNVMVKPEETALNENNSELPDISVPVVSEVEEATETVEGKDSNLHLPPKERWKRMFEKARQEVGLSPKHRSGISCRRKKRPRERLAEHITTLEFSHDIPKPPDLDLNAGGKDLEYIPTTLRDQAGRVAKSRKICLSSPTCLQDVGRYPNGSNCLVP